MYKNTEVRVYLNGSIKDVVVLVPVEKSKMQVIQSVKSKSQAEIKLASIEGREEDVQKKISKISDDYNNLIKDSLKEAFPGMNVKYTENNKLMTFDLKEDEQEQVWFYLGEKPQSITELCEVTED